AVAGVATFGDLSLNRAGTGYTLTAAATGVASGTSAAFDVGAAAADRLVFTVQPVSTTAGAAIAPAVQVTAQDGLGNTVPSFTGSVTVALGNNPVAGTLTGTTTVAATNGVASFASLSIDRAGSGYTLTAAATGVTTGSSAAFSITPGTAATLLFTVQPSNALAGAAIAPAVQVVAHDAQGNTATGFSVQPSNTSAATALTPAVQVTARDAQGNVATDFTGTVTVALGINPGGATLSGTTSVAAVSGVATFSSLSIDKVGTGYTLTAV